MALVGSMLVCQRTCGDMQTLGYLLWTCAFAHQLRMIGGAFARVVCLAQSCPVLLCLLVVMALTRVVNVKIEFLLCVGRLPMVSHLGWVVST